MRLNFLRLSPDERKTYVDEAASRRGLSPVILEKDFWVCWLLGVLFKSTFSEALVFKGGTSLSKVFGAIDRFSEDIDLSLAPTFLGLADADLSAPLSKGQASKWMKRAEDECARAVHEQLQPELDRAITDILGARSDGWLEFMIDANTHSPVLVFKYPTTQPVGFEYLKRAVKLEFGSLTDQQPVGSHSVRSWIAESLPDEFNDWHCDVVALEIQRTFWEKATILHAEYHRPAEKPTPDRFSRHYADVAALAAHPDALQAVGDNDLRDRVVTWKSQFFGSNWARYDLANPGTFRLVPPPERVRGLRRDYEAMREMYLSSPPGFDELLARLATLERRINRDQPPDAPSS